jgi:hypothetical protein
MVNEMHDLDVEISAITVNLKAEHHKALASGSEWNLCASDKQLFGLNGLLRQGMKDTDRRTRLSILKIITGQAVADCLGIREIVSSRNLSAPMISVLINLLREPESSPWRLSDYGRWLISATEAKAEILLGQLQLPSMPDMR